MGAGGESRCHRARLLVVHPWDWPYVGELGAYANERLGKAEFDDARLTCLRHGRCGSRRRREPVEVEDRVVQGQPAKALLEAAAGADLLVVGSRGRGGFTGLLLGSVSQQCIQHAPCPVVVPPAERTGG